MCRVAYTKSRDLSRIWRHKFRPLYLGLVLATDHSPIVTAMLNPVTYTHPVDRVEMLQTHISYVFLAGEYVYKIKKSVNFGFLN